MYIREKYLFHIDISLHLNLLSDERLDFFK